MMIPPMLIPLLIKIGSKLVDMAFNKLESLPTEKKSKCLDKIEANDKKKLEKDMKPKEDEYDEADW
jgi:hypothetical protein